ncbi:MAG: hypothetical protein HeimC3_18660 [Candidatus Heimdallarchaeota archaeon LC_3]|nr:MAG: hypothetical protein HeimC3_18660 [Candidatus Heimdallarchaeota archaeon LC_3]
MKHMKIILIIFLLFITLTNVFGQIRSYDRNDLVIIAEEAGAFEIYKIDSIQEFIDTINNTESPSSPWKAYIQKSDFLLAVNMTNFSIVIGQTPWTSMNTKDNNLTIDIQTLDDPLDDYGISLWIQFNDTGSQRFNLDSSLIDESTLKIMKHTTFYRVSFEMIYNWEIDFSPKDFQGTLQYFVLTPVDDEKVNTKIYETQPVLDYPRTYPNSNSIADTDIGITLGMNNSNYWESGQGTDCPRNQIFIDDLFNLKCEQIIKSVSSSPLFHGNWSTLQPITTKPTDRFQIFGQQGPIKLSINTEIRQNNTEDTGIIDVFLDNFMWIYPKIGEIPFEIFGDVVNENKGNSVTYVTSYFGVMLGIVILIKIKLRKKNTSELMII